MRSERCLTRAFIRGSDRTCLKYVSERTRRSHVGAREGRHWGAPVKYQGSCEVKAKDGMIAGMKRRIAIAAALAALASSAIAGAAFAWTPGARDCGARCVESVQHRGNDAEMDRRGKSPFLRGPGNGDRFGGPVGDRFRANQPGIQGREPLADGQIWAIAKARVPGRIVNARLQGSVYSFRIISNRGSIVDVVVDRYSGRIVTVRGGP